MHSPELYGLIILGFVAGLSGGLLGIGGGSITVPILYLLLKKKDLFPSDTLMQIVIGTTFAAMCLNALVSVVTHHMLSNVRWKRFAIMLPGLIVGPIIGAFIAYHTEGEILRYAFGIFQCLIAGYLLFVHQKPIDPSMQHHVSATTLISTAFFVGTVGSILGIGGGVLLVPLFIFLKMPMRSAVGTSAAGTFVMILLSAIAYLFVGMGKETLEAGQAGFVYLPAFLAIGLSSVAGAPLGAYLTAYIPTESLKKIFALIQAILGIILIIN